MRKAKSLEMSLIKNDLHQCLPAVQLGADLASGLCAPLLVSSRQAYSFVQTALAHTRYFVTGHNSGSWEGWVLVNRMLGIVVVVDIAEAGSGTLRETCMGLHCCLEGFRSLPRRPELEHAESTDLGCIFEFPDRMGSRCPRRDNWIRSRYMEFLHCSQVRYILVFRIGQSGEPRCLSGYESLAYPSPHHCSFDLPPYGF